MYFKDLPSGSGGRSRSTHIYSIDLTGYNEREVQTPMDASDPAWSPLIPERRGGNAEKKGGSYRAALFFGLSVWLCARFWQKQGKDLARIRRKRRSLPFFLHNPYRIGRFCCAKDTPRASLAHRRKIWVCDLDS
jgi:hypothetical protein